MTSASRNSLLRGRYRLLEPLGRGGMGNVWLAADELLGRRVALKELVLVANGEPMAVRRERALREARAAAGIKHPSVVDIHDVFEDRGCPWIVMAYIEGRSLRDLIDEGELDERDIARIGLHVLGGLNAAHDAGVLHRDVKPANIVIGRAGEVLLVDFGVAQIGGASPLTAQNGFVGTLEFMSPERIDGRTLTPASDLWSLGVTLFWALERYSPFGREEVVATLRAITDHACPRPARRGPLSEAIARLLHKDPDRRMKAGELDLVLRSLVRNHAARPAQAGPGTRDRHAGRAASARPAAPHRPRPGGDAPPRPQAAPPRPQAAPPRPQAAPPRPSAPLGDLPAESAARLCARLPAEAGRDLLAKEAPDVAGRVLLALPRDVAASILAVTPARTTGVLLGAMAFGGRETAALLQTLKAARAGRALDYMDLDAAARLLTVMPPHEAARILVRAYARTAAGIITILAAGPVAAHVVDAMSEHSAKTVGEVLGHVPPAAVAGLLRSLPERRAVHLLDRLGTATRARVLRHLEPS
ncbi:protein kinase [Sphaerisporangium sp. TRM90804]|uniref:serine/threonine-protein kinase n=1 Tax=Sphaerisporangium sp. TRM90804 TaxID=3031113 RepID=UPI0024484624|nr:protein kinase [Sphaerisporangium sp. TRM90804]MDH2427422.1 protein kinase [Sphaerisporangium sp. TRM90804]